jgi:CheY-like chemotaxis protein
MLRCQREQFALVLVDHMMPGITGVEFTRALREMITYRSVPVVMVTADHSPELRRDAIEAGVTDFLTKPVEAIAFRHLISGLLLASGLNDSTAA